MLLTFKAVYTRKMVFYKSVLRVFKVYTANKVRFVLLEYNITVPFVMVS